MSLALYRKYRPRTLADLLGQEEVVTVLQNAARTDRIAHAYLLYGSRGSGKTTTARLIAKLANCETRAVNVKFKEKGEPCNRCRPCEEIDAGRALDVMEIDAASNRGIDEVRSLKEGIRLAPSSYRSKVFIVDEVHQLTKDAMSALLKTLEEPPSHAIFVLATTEYEKVPATIASRCQRFHFRRVPLKLLAEKLAEIVKQEQFKVSDEAIELIASISDGSFRDAESLLDQLTALGGEIDAARVEKLIGRIGFRRTAALADLILAGDLAKSLQYVAEIQEAGFNVVDLARELIHYLRRALSLKFNPELAALLGRELTDRELAEVRRHSALMSAEAHVPLLRSLIRAYSEMRYSPFASVPLEVALIEHLQKGK